MEKETWVEMWNFPTYEVSNLGRVRNAKTEKVLKLASDASAYQMVRLFYNKKKYTKRLGRLIWNSFNNCECENTIDHRDRNKSNDRLDNLRCITSEEQMTNRTPKAHHNQYNLTPEIKKQIQTEFENGSNYHRISRKYKIPYNYIRSTMLRGSWKKYL
jgi:hypothetical protein